MEDFVSFTGLDGAAKAVAMLGIRMLEDRSEGPGVTVTLVDGTQFDVVGSVESILLAQRSPR